MGYCMSQMSSDFRIDASRVADCLAAIKAIPTRGHSYSWVDDRYAEAATIEEVFRAWRWDIQRGADPGDVIDIQFHGEKYGDDDVLWKTIAPFVDDGSFIEMQGEEGERWRWVFTDGKVVEKNARMVWDD